MILPLSISAFHIFSDEKMSFIDLSNLGFLYHPSMKPRFFQGSISPLSQELRKINIRNSTNYLVGRVSIPGNFLVFVITHLLPQWLAYHRTLNLIYPSINLLFIQPFCCAPHHHFIPAAAHSIITG